MNHSLQNAEKSLSVILIILVNNMKSVIKRCKHCQCEYTYYLSGFYCRIPLNDKDYCPSCKKLMIKALGGIPKKYKSEYKEIPIDEELLSIFKKLKDEKENKQGVINCSTIVCEPLVYDNVELYSHNGKSYALCKNNDEINFHLFLLSELDIQKNEFTNKAWLNDSPDSYKKGSPLCRRLGNLNANEYKLPPPIGKLFYTDLTNNCKN